MGVSVKVSDTVYENVSGVYLPLTDGTGNHFFADTTWMDGQGVLEIAGLERQWFPIKKEDIGGATGLSFPDCTVSAQEIYGAFSTLNFPKLKQIIKGGIKSSACTELRFPELKTCSVMYGLGYHANATKIVLPKINTIGNSCFWNDSALETLVFGGDTKVAFVARCVDGCTKLLDGSGFIYVKSALLAQYQADESWAASGVSFRAIEDYPDVME